jgi:hypothetical protein
MLFLLLVMLVMLVIRVEIFVRVTRFKIDAAMDLRLRATNHLRGPGHAGTKADEKSQVPRLYAAFVF